MIKFLQIWELHLISSLTFLFVIPSKDGIVISFSKARENL